MKHNMKKIISLVLVLAMSLAISVPGFAAEKQAAPEPQVQTVSSKAMASGKTYGPWFGSNTQTYTTKGAYQVGLFVEGVLLTALSPLLGQTLAASTVAGLGGTATGIAFTLPDDYVYGSVSKRYREVFISGEFAYYQSELTTKAYMHKDGKNSYLGKTTQIYEGASLMSINDKQAA